MKVNRIFQVIAIVWLVFAGFAPFGQKAAAAVQPAQAPEIIRRPIRESSPVFNQCTPSQQAALVRAFAAAKGLAFNSFQVLDNTPESQRSSSTRFQEWFGPYDLANYLTVLNQFKHIYDALVTQTTTFNCDCSEVWLAYVYLDRPYEIHLCTAYWELTETGTDTQAGVIVHEMSHFPEVAGTRDAAYNHDIAKMSAGWTAPATAIINAASYQYYAENDPSFEPRVPDVAWNATVND